MAFFLAAALACCHGEASRRFCSVARAIGDARKASLLGVAGAGGAAEVGKIQSKLNSLFRCFFGA
jgi:hypothetical protein